jgi:hypothetical protein
VLFGSTIYSLNLAIYFSAIKFLFNYLTLEQLRCFQLIFIQGEICARGYWNVIDDSSKEILLGQFRNKIENAGLNDLKDTLYFPQDAGNDESHNNSSNSIWKLHTVFYSVVK